MTHWSETPCPTCQAEPGDRCLAEDGSHVLGGAHAARVRESLAHNKENE